MTQPWAAHDHIHDTPPKNKAKSDRTAVTIVMVGIILGLVQFTVKEVVVSTIGRLKRLKQNLRP